MQKPENKYVLRTALKNDILFSVKDVDKDSPKYLQIKTHLGCVYIDFAATHISCPYDGSIYSKHISRGNISIKVPDFQCIYFIADRCLC